MLAGPVVPRVGAQRPRLESYPAAVSSAADDAFYLMDLVGRPLDDWQRHVVEHAMGERPDGRWAAFEVGLICPRQNGKNVCIEARELAGLFILQDRVIIHSAHQFKTARKSFREMEQLIRRTPELYRQILGWHPGLGSQDRIAGIRTNGAELSIETADGCKLEYQARSSGGGRGFTGDLIVLDEAYDIDPGEIAAMMPTMAARSIDGNPQIWYTSSAGMPASEVLADIRDRGMSKDPGRLAFFEWSAHPEADTDDVDSWYEANPALGIRISEEFVRDTEFEAMGEEEFRRERLGIWAQAGHDGIITAKDWNACADADLVRALTDEGLQVDQGLRGVRIGVDVSPDRSRASVAVAGVRRDGRLWVEVIDRGAGPEWLVPAITPIWQRRAAGSPLLIAGGSAAGDLARDFRRAGARVRLLSQQDYASACGRFVDGVRGGHVRHLSQVELNEAVAAAAPSSKGGRLFTWKRSDVSKDITPLVAVTLAASQLWRDLLDGVVAPAGGASDSDGPGQVRARVRRSRPRVLRERKGVRERATYD